MNGRDLRELRAERIGKVFQNMAFMPHRTVRENVAFSLEVRGRPDEERARVADRAIAADPSILLMDEPFSALDSLIRRQRQDVFIDLAAQMHKTTVFITHDLDEAIRIGHCIAIMKDGVLVQVGTPEENVTRPADAYAADFVAGISKLDLVKTAQIMQPLGLYERENGPVDGVGWPVAQPEDTLNALVDLVVGTDHPILVSAEGQRLGVVTKRALLRGIQGRDEAPNLALKGAAGWKTKASTS